MGLPMMYADFLAVIESSPLASCANIIADLLDEAGRGTHGDTVSWQQALDNLPDILVDEVDLCCDAIRVESRTITEQTRQQLQQALMQLHPWRKGPFDVFGVHIDSEWRSDFKWRRLATHLPDLQGQCILDVGCGNGYYGWRMRGAGAKWVIGIDPTLRFIYQYKAINRYTVDDRFFVLPLKSEQLPAELASFDSVFSMGVIYHRRSAPQHLQELWSFLKPGGLLVLESLVVRGDEHTVLVPDRRYAKMRNVWFVPSVRYLRRQLERAGFVDAQCVDETVTRAVEQRKTPWMRYQSLADFLDPSDPGRTIEGYPAPCRAILLARKPS